MFNNLYVKNFPNSEYTEAELRSAFEAFGLIVSVKIDQSNAFGFVAFEKCEDALAALNHYTNKATE